MSRPYVIAFSNQKGGVGKTTSCVNIASSAAARGLRVLLIDEDPQGNSTSGVGISKKSISTANTELPLVTFPSPRTSVQQLAFPFL